MSAPRALLCDLDGVVYRGARPCAGAVTGLRHIRKRGVAVLFLTNNAGATPAEVAGKLTAMGVAAVPREVLTSSMVAASYLRSNVPASGWDGPVLAIGGPGVAAALEQAGLPYVTPQQRRAMAEASDELPAVSVVVQGYGAQVSALDLAEGAYALQDGAQWVATNTDATLPNERGLAPGNGSLIAALQHATGRRPDVVVGKPHPPAYRAATALLGFPPEQVLAAGDRLDTDIEGANTAGLQTALVLTGVHQRTDADGAAAQARPDLVVQTLEELAQVAWP